MNATLTVVRQLGQLSRELDKAVEELGKAELEAVDAEADYKVAYSKAFREAEGPVEDRKQIATAQTDDLFRVWGKAVAVVRLQREHIKALHARIDVGRTIQSTARAEMALAGSGVTP
ncbi:hypothetical protein FLW53_09350 [Microbispora sp. SCL1-1]|uniref:hypothetical protein n=1 Tax=unclassified Microbispora TaxID=2614687 RepID=UPI001157F12C|nr:MULTISPECIES: hypothetical protein [unclassified Microbispora]NJP24404.1 hypothetical protein [Microbispora sp. CL1-1]TQS14558.1 hypothetical protein FLW53_09350 [Microbispora sp. SCL1-1]